MIKLKRVYELANKNDGYRVLVDRLWPRGLTKEKAQVDLWLKDIAPSTELRKWFGHDSSKWSEFKKRYHNELKENPIAVAQLVDLLEKRDITVVYGANDEIHNEAVVLKEYLEKEIA